jgi:alkylation response protein AidB-like acyl-CoA dehydrogenase
MRATGSHELELNEVFVPSEAVILVREWGVYDAHAQEVMKWFALTVASTYTGIAGAARDTALQLFGRAGGDTSDDRLLRLRELGEIEIDLAASAALIASSAAAVDRNEFHTQPALLKRCLVAKYFATNAALRVVHASMELAGGMGYLKRSPLERFYRDARAGIIHPLNNRDALVMIGEIASGAWGAQDQVESETPSARRQPDDHSRPALGAGLYGANNGS